MRLLIRRKIVIAGALVTAVVAAVYIAHLAGELTVFPTIKKLIQTTTPVTNSKDSPTTKKLTQTTTPVTNSKDSPIIKKLAQTTTSVDSPTMKKLAQTTTPVTNSTRLLCLILATYNRLDRWKAVNSTWAKRCDQHLFIIADANIKESDVLVEGNVLKVKSKEWKLTEKVKRALQFAYGHCNGCFDWVLKADDDTYVIVENLKQLLQQHSPSNAYYMGLHFKPKVKQGFMSGGAGYVMSHEALRQLVEHGLNEPRCKQFKDEDVYIGNCFQILNISIQNSRDNMGKERFHAEPLVEYLHPPHPKWLPRYHWVKPMFGDDCCSRYPISFHHLTPGQIKLYEHLIYKTHVFGRAPDN